jgi:hypothetical protein
MAYVRVQTSDTTLNRIQTNLNDALQPLETSPLTGGTMLSGVVLAAGQNNVAHGLQRLPHFFVVTYLNANTAVWASAPFDSTYLYLSVSTACTVSLWVD